MTEEMKKSGFTEVDPTKLDTLDFNPYKRIGGDWFLVTAGDKSGWNTMTASWGFAGVMWGKNTFTTVIRPQRYTKEFIDNSQYFTISFFDSDCKSALSYCGSHSGRDCDKAVETGLKPLFITGDNFSVTSFEQANLVLICRKSYVQEMKPECFVNTENDEKWYPAKDYHVQYIGEIVAAYTN
jgi:flavin reductase (DIM6/NTAB) family NADH-FMN oxidoreductase RutF